MAPDHRGEGIRSTTRDGILGRRQFLQRAAVTVGGAATLIVQGARSSVASGPGPSASPRRLRTAFRLSTHSRKACSACKAHGANRFYRTIGAANNDRAHVGCNCGIVPHPLLAGIYHCMFARDDVYDRRWATAHCPEP